MQRATAANDQPQRSSGPAAADGEKVFRGDEEFNYASSNYLKTIFALALWLGTFHLNAVLILLTLLVLSLSQALLLIGLLLVLMLIPIDENSKFGRKLSRYICKHVCSYFPVILHVEDMKAFHPNRAYGLPLTLHSSLTSEYFS
ncbi:hypothetical protein V8G54_004548 [Vigna mungo]|uniref:Uncharacterized protein n=1 Tax=Vigna mungo TaxID=3915 RepID=A0AAQ3SB80_VIGMU